MSVYAYKTKTGKQFLVKFIIKGKQIYKRGFHTRKDALIFETSMIDNPGSYSFKELIVSDISMLFIDEINKKVKVTTAYNKILTYKKYILPYFENQKITNITDTSIRLYINTIVDDRKISREVKKKILFIFKEFIEFLQKYGCGKLYPVDLELPYDSSSRISHEFDYYTIDEFNKFISVVKNKKYKLLFELLFYFGLRISECLGLHFNDFTSERVYIRGALAIRTGKHGQQIVSTKTKSSTRDYPLIDVIRDDYNNYVASFTNSYKKPI